MCPIEEAEEKIMAGLGAPFSPLCPYDVTDLRGAATAGRRMEAKVALGSCMVSSCFLSIHTDSLLVWVGWCFVWSIGSLVGFSPQNPTEVTFQLSWYFLQLNSSESVSFPKKMMPLLIWSLQPVCNILCYMTVLHYIFVSFIPFQSIVHTKSLHAEHDFLESTGALILIINSIPSNTMPCQDNLWFLHPLS